MTENTSQQRMRALLDQQATRRRDEQANSRQANALARGKWWGTRRSSRMRSKRRRCA